MTFNCLLKFRSFGSAFPLFSITHSVLDVLCHLKRTLALSLPSFNCLALPKFRSPNNLPRFRTNSHLSLTHINIFFHLYHFEFELPLPRHHSPRLNSHTLAFFIMIDELDFPIHFPWTSIHNGTIYYVIRVKYDVAGNLTMTLANGYVLNLYVGNAKWYEFTTLIHSSDFKAPRSHGLRGLIHFNKLKTKLNNTDSIIIISLIFISPS